MIHENKLNNYVPSETLWQNKIGMPKQDHIKSLHIAQQLNIKHNSKKSFNLNIVSYFK